MPIGPIRSPHPNRLGSISSILAVQASRSTSRIAGTHISRCASAGCAPLEGIDDGLIGSRVTVTIDAESLEANVPFVVGLVKGIDMLDVARYPAIHFGSTPFSRTGTTTGS
ncbi:YceI family protein [Ralstonia syzygii]|uniref:YceI family protein n=1 Tax=Ralstonia syzygii TaxID=28097 RepID=UPI0027DD7818|nr:YceI family protein [Ralstonia syzygii]